MLVQLAYSFYCLQQPTGHHMARRAAAPIIASFSKHANNISNFSCFLRSMKSTP
jgi:adenine-specific DNA methylase